MTHDLPFLRPHRTVQGRRAMEGSSWVKAYPAHHNTEGVCL